MWLRFLKRTLFFSVLLVIYFFFMFLPILELFLIYVVFYKPKWFMDL